jgi:hypothetical protein
MSRKVLKSAALLLVLGSVFQFGSCLGGDWWRLGLRNAATYTALEFVLDNNGVIDLFSDGATQAL